MPTYLERNLWTDMTGITTVEQYEEMYGPGSFERDSREREESARRIAELARFFISPDGQLCESRADGLYCDGKKVSPASPQEKRTFSTPSAFYYGDG